MSASASIIPIASPVVVIKAMAVALKYLVIIVTIMNLWPSIRAHPLEVNFMRTEHEQGICVIDLLTTLRIASERVTFLCRVHLTIGEY